MYDRPLSEQGLIDKIKNGYGETANQNAILEEMQKFHDWYQKKHPNASRREIRRAVLRKFNLHYR